MVNEIFTKAKDHLRAIAGDAVSIIKKEGRTNTDKVVGAIKDIPKTDMSPVMKASKSNSDSVVNAINKIDIPSDVSISNPEAITKDLKAGLSSVVTTLKEEVTKLGDKEIVVKNDLSQLASIFKTSQDKKSLIDALSKVEGAIKAIDIPTMPEIKDTSDILLKLIKTIENKENLTDILKEIRDKEFFLPPTLSVDLDPILIEDDRLRVVLRDDQVAKMGEVLQGGDNKHVIIANGDGDIDVQNPLSTDGDSVYEKDIDITLSDAGTFTGSVDELFNSYDGTIALTDTTSTNPKWYKVKINRPVTTSKITIGTSGYTFSNVKLTLMSGGGEIVDTIDDSANSTGYINHTYHFNPVKFNVVKVEFYTTNATYIAGMSINKDTEVVARLQALKPDGTLTDIDATAGGNLKVSIEEVEPGANTPFLLQVSQGLVPGHSIINKFGQNDTLNSTTYEDIWDGGATYTYPADGSADITKIVSTDAADTMDVEVQGLDITGVLTVQTITLTGTTAVVLPTALWRVFRMKNVGATDNVGIVSAQNTALSVIYAIMQIGNNQTLMALYTIPLGCTGYLYQGTNNLSDTTRAVGASGRLTMRPYGGVFQLKKTFGVNSEGNSYIRVPNPLPGKIPALTDIRVSAIGSANGVSLNTTFDILLIEN